MGVVGLWPFLKDKGYEPKLRLQSTLQNHQPSQPSFVRVDVLGAFFPTVRRAYSSKDLDDAHAILEKDITQFGTKSTLVLYLDGVPALEKAPTTANREEQRKTNLDLAQKHLNEFETLVNDKQPLKKRHFVAISKPLQKAFYWDRPARQSFAQYLKARGWMVVECQTEADLSIGSDCQPGDVVITRDSDLLIYPKVACIWRPISKGRVLEYRVTDVLASLNLTRAQLTVLGVVSRNDYTKNVEGLGPKTNFSIVKRLTDTDPIVMVDAYLADKRVLHKNTEQKTFENSIRVFLKGEQTLAPSAIVIAEQGQHYVDIKAKFKELCETRTERRLIIRTVPVESDVETRPTNPFATVDKQDPAKAHQYRPRYSPKVRFEPSKEQPAPPISLQYVLKPWKEPPPKPSLPQPAKKKPPTPIKSEISEDNRFGRKEMRNALSFEHPMVCLDLDRLSRNVHAVSEDDHISKAIIDCIRGAVQVAWDAKRQCQMLIGLYLEDLFYPSPSPGAPRPSVPVTRINQQDQAILDNLCPRLSSMEMTDTDDGGSPAEDGEDDGTNAPFIRSFLTFLYSGNLPGTSKTGAAVNDFIRRLQEMGHLEKLEVAKADLLRNVKEYTPSLITRSVASQLSAELKRHYRHGAVKVSEKVQTLIKKGQLANNQAVDLTAQDPAIQLFVRANAAAGRPWRLSPLSSEEHGYMTFTEKELLCFLHKRDDLHPVLKKLTGCTDPHRRLSQADLIVDWLPFQTPGVLIQRLIAPVDPKTVSGERLRGRQRKDAGVAAAVRVPDPKELCTHINTLRRDGFDPRTYQEKGYFLSGSIKTDGYNLQLLAFKVRELNSVKYKRYGPAVLPYRLLTTTAGTGDFLTEVRNVFKTPADVERLLGCTPDELDKVSYLGLDLGQAFVVGAYAHLPQDKNPRGRRRRNNKRRGSRGRRKRGSGRGVKIINRSGQARHINLAANQKAVARPTLMHRYWIERQKCAALKIPSDSSTAPPPANQPPSSTTVAAAPETLSINAIESAMPHLRGDSANFHDHVQYRKEHQAHLASFYNGKQYRFKKYQRMSKKARDREYERLTDALLRMVGGTIGEQRKDEDKVVIGVGLGQFTSTSRLSSLHGTFESYFIHKARSLGYLVVGVNEYYTSKRCPSCEQFVAQAGNIRRLYCARCRKYLHRDVLAGHNIVNILQSHVERQERPLYLQPIDKDGKYPWQQDGEGAAAGVGSGVGSGAAAGAGAGVAREAGAARAGAARGAREAGAARAGAARGAREAGAARGVRSARGAGSAAVAKGVGAAPREGSAAREAVVETGGGGTGGPSRKRHAKNAENVDTESGKRTKTVVTEQKATPKGKASSKAKAKSQ